MKQKELTIHGLILGVLITTIFTAANVYLGLKVGLTIASSIPAAVISMAARPAGLDDSLTIYVRPSLVPEQLIRTKRR